MNKAAIEELSYEDWYAKHEGEIYIELAETGADRELDFDSEYEFEKRYIEFVKSLNCKD